MPHQHAVASGQFEPLRTHFVLTRLVSERHRHLELDPLVVVGAHFRPGGYVAGDRTQLGIDHEVHGAAHVLVLRTLLDQFDEVAPRQHQHLFAQSLHLGLDEVVGAPVDDARDREIHHAEEERGAAGEYHRIDDGDSKRRCVEQSEEPLVGAQHPAAPGGHYSSSRRL